MGIRRVIEYGVREYDVRSELAMERHNSPPPPSLPYRNHEELVQQQRAEHRFAEKAHRGGGGSGGLREPTLKHSEPVHLKPPGVYGAERREGSDATGVEREGRVAFVALGVLHLLRGDVSEGEDDDAGAHFRRGGVRHVHGVVLCQNPPASSSSSASSSSTGVGGSVAAGVVAPAAPAAPTPSRRSLTTSITSFG